LLYYSLKEKNSAPLHQRGKSNEEDSSENRRNAKNAQKRNNLPRIKKTHHCGKGISRVFSRAMPGKNLFLPQPMSDRFSQPEQRPGFPKQNPLILHRAALFLQPSLGKGIGIVIVLAFGSGAVLLANDLPWPTFTPFAHAPISAIPLLSIGLAALGFQFVIRPNLLDLFKACIVSAAFLLWGIDQLLPSGWLAMTLGDVVIVLYVIDLGWMMADRLAQQALSRRVSQEKVSSSPLVPDLSDGPTQPLHILPLPSSSSRAPQTTRQPEQSPLFPPVPGQATHSPSAFKRNRLLPLPKTPQERQPLAKHG
jgi:hypothetical protein